MPKNKTAASPTTTPRALRLLWLLGPALVAGIAYVDPGNVASNVTAGAQYGYLLVWVVVTGNVMAWLIQYLSAKLGLVTGKSLPELLGERLTGRARRLLYWGQAELVAMATDLAEVIGGAVALNLLFDLPLLLGGVITGGVSMIVLAGQSRYGQRPFESVIISLLLIVVIGFCAGTIVAGPDAAAAVGGLVPRFDGAESVLLAASIIGATVMPHAIYAHSALTRDRFPGSHASRPAHPGSAATSTATQAAMTTTPSSSSSSSTTPSTTDNDGDLAQNPASDARNTPRSAGSAALSAGRASGGLSTRRLLRATRWDVSIAMVIAGTVNLAMILLGASALFGVAGTDSLEGAYSALASTLGIAVATLFAVGLLASGLASTSVGAYAGAEIMHGLLHVRVPLIWRRIVTLVPALLILAIGFDPTTALILSQVVLSFGIPFALVPLVWLTASRRVMGEFRNRIGTTIAGATASALLVALNVVLLVLLVSGA